MIIQSSRTTPLLAVAASCLVLLGVLASGLSPRAVAQVQADNPVLTLQASLCPPEYEDVAFAADCTEPLSDFAFDIAGPVNTETTTGDDGLTDLDETPRGAYAIEALDFDPDDGFVVRCERPVTGGSLPVDIDYTSAGFNIDLAAEMARELPASSDPANEVACTWYALPDATTSERAGIVEVTGRRCPGGDDEPGILTLGPGDDAIEVAERLADCDPVDAEVTLVNEETGDETQVEAVEPEVGFTAANVPAGSYTATVGDSEPSDAFTVDPGESTLVLAVVIAPVLEVSVRPGPTAVPDPTAVPEPTAEPEPLPTIEFGPGDWQDAFPNINEGVYDRAAVAVYGALSPFPTASLRFELPSAPASGATLTIEGLADELGPAQITVTVNGVEAYRGDSGFAGWDPSAASPAWTPVDYPIPAGVFQAGENEIIVANLANSAAFGLPPYVLLSVATLRFEG